MCDWSCLYNEEEGKRKGKQPGFIPIIFLKLKDIMRKKVYPFSCDVYSSKEYMYDNAHYY